MVGGAERNVGQMIGKKKKQRRSTRGRNGGRELPSSSLLCSEVASVCSSRVAHGQEPPGTPDSASARQVLHA
eukprot:3202718-Rhodomonas_salina.2